MTIPNFKVKYIISDAKRGTKKKTIGKIYSPLGKPARKAYSIFPIIDFEKVLNISMNYFKLHFMMGLILEKMNIYNLRLKNLD